uniref:OSJNBa0035O13.7 protein n=1 Tax=Oryza sativa subsp. japonica TaxID=39947 RepID=Q7XSL9_ORYSJ|nr:OSJNBa0035O13.7 [Oryza sativa Japonica Group]
MTSATTSAMTSAPAVARQRMLAGERRRGGANEEHQDVERDAANSPVTKEAAEKQRTAPATRKKRRRRSGRRRRRQTSRRSRDHRQPTAPSAGCRALSRSLRDVRWPERFRPGAIEKYDGSTDPEEFLQVYSTVLYAAGADDNALANYLPTAWKGSARSWLMHLPSYSISSWSDLWQQFVANFQGTNKRHAIEDDLHALTHNSGESLRGYVRRFNECRNTIPEITDASVICAFKSGVRDHYTTQVLATRRITTTQRLFEIVERCAHVDDALRRKNDKPKTGGEKKPTADASESSKKKNHKNGKRKAQAEVLAAEYANPPKRPDPQGSDTKKSWCPIHKTDRHSLEDCLVFKKSLEKHMAFEKGKRGAAPKMKWSEQRIEFSAEDHPKTSVIPGRYPIVVKPTIRNVKVARVLINGGSSINLLFASTLDAMGVPQTYSAIIGRTALAKFMAASHYAYQVLKIPGPKGTITIQGNAKLAVQCDKRSLDMVEQMPTPPATSEPPKKLVDSTAGCELLSFLDAYSGYHQISMVKEDEEKTVFITPFGVFCYVKMPFGLITAGNTFQRTVQGALSNQLGNNVEAYVDDIVVKTKTSDSLIDDLRETFDNPRRYRLMLNPEKCTFGVPSGKLLGFLVSGRGIEANPEKIKAIENMKSPTRLKEVQKLTGCMAALSRFVARMGERGQPFFALLKKQDKFVWTQEAEEAFIALKRYLSKPPVLVAPQPNEELFLYIAATPYSVSTVIVVEREKVQRPVYYIQKLLYAVIMTSRKLRHYFQAHRVTVVSSFPLGEVVRNKDVVGRIAKWVVELSQFDIHFVPQTAIKSHVLADFVADWTIPDNKSDSQGENETWTMAFDGALNSQGAGAGFILTSPSGDQFKHAIHLNFRATNNTAEYEGLLAGIRAAAALGAKRLIIKGDSELVANQVHKDYKCSNPELSKYLSEVRKLERRFDGIEVRHVYRKDNVEPDDLARRASRREPLEPGTFLDVLTKPSVKEVSGEVGPSTPDISSEVTEAECEVADIETTDDWRSPLIKFIGSEELPEDDTEAEKITRKAKIYSPNGIFLKCVSTDDGKQLLLDIHEGICGSHAAGRTLVGKAFRQGFFWPTALKDACDMVQRCEACQFHSKHKKLPAQALQTIPLTWPFSCWGLDILGPFPRGQGGYRFLFVAINKFTKWIEAVPTGEIKADNAIKFVRGIFCRYGLPHRIITDNGSQFISADFQDYCIGLGVKICFASVSHPQSNGQAERANGIVLQGIKTRVYDRLMSHDKKWVEELPSVLWAVRTTPTTSNKETPFFLVYGSEAMLPDELRHQSTRVQKHSDENQENQRDIDVNLLEEHRERVAVRAASYQQALRRYHEKRIRARILSIGDYVLRRVQTQAGRNKLSPKWEGPNTITQVLRPGAFKIADGDGRELANSWNIDQLRKFYV